MGCSVASCAFGCQPVGSSGFTCACPRGYETVGSASSHCVAVNEPENFRSAGDWDYADVDDGGGVDDGYLTEGDDQEVISTEGCFACQMNGAGGKKPKASRPRQNTAQRYVFSCQ
jgi:hypothetical protein